MTAAAELTSTTLVAVLPRSASALLASRDAQILESGKGMSLVACAQGTTSYPTQVEGNDVRGLQNWDAKHNFPRPGGLVK